MASPPSSTSVTLRAQSKIYLIGHVSSQIVGSKLPSNRQVLSVLFHNLRFVKLNLHDSAILLIKETVIFWQKARIPVREEHHCVSKLEKLYQSWRKLQKSSNRASDKARANVSEFVDQLNDLFDVAHGKALDMIRINEDRNFLLSQRQKGRPGCMLGTDQKSSEQEKKADEKLQRLEERRKRAHEDLSLSGTHIEFGTSSISVEETSDSMEEGEVTSIAGPSSFSLGRPFSSSNKRGRTEFITYKLISALDKCKVSDRDAMHIIMATAEALCVDTGALVLNKSSLQRLRREFREEKTKERQRTFRLEGMTSLVVHWDTKLLPDFSEHGTVERLPVVVSFEGSTQLLGVPKLENGTGKKQAEAVHSVLHEWGIAEKVKALCCDTTASNTGHLKGACVLLEQFLTRDLLYLPCRRHILEIVLRGVFDVKFATPTSGPDVQLFKRFRDQWSTIDVTNFESGVAHEIVEQSVHNTRDSVVQFCLSSLQQRQCRDDYKELLELTVIFLGENPPRETPFRYPGAFHHARWMSKAVYCLKIFMFRKQFHLKDTEERALQDVCLFIVNLYVEAWFRCPNAVEAPFNDFMFLKALAEYSDIQASQVALHKFCGHLWYLAPEIVAISLFDARMPKETKLKMVEAMRSAEHTDGSNNNKKYVLSEKNVKDIVSQDFSQFVTSKTMNFFSRFEVSDQFLNLVPDKWETDSHYQQAFHVFSKLLVTNDVAERGVKLIQEYNNILTKDENSSCYKW